MMFRRPRVKNEAHLQFIRSLFCVICGDNTSVEAAHLRAGNMDYGKRETGLGEKPSDMWVLPVCSKHHRDQHKGCERSWWHNRGIDPWRLALSLFAASGDHELAQEVIARQVQR